MCLLHQKNALYLQTLINILLAFDAYFAWYFPFKASVPFMCPMDVREARAFDNMHRAIDMFEMFERLSINNHKSFLPHLAVFKVGFSTAPVRKSVVGTEFWRFVQAGNIC